MGNPVVHFEIRTQDRRKAMQFYGELFDWKIAPDDRTGNLMIYAGEHPTGSIMETPSPGGTGVMNYIRVDNIEQALTQVEQLGGKRQTGRTELSGIGCWATFTDPEGNQMGLWEHLPVPEVDPSLLA